ncbi:MAG: hypothetical protein HKP48_00120 [Winogradskyella sp.]|uniref:DUF6799 domain-containing protein n=1 Tax=Winogradskyella sp. TaxID=1883156 RepID=UPI001820E6DB|nr:DUF6799 domain-containing protein [Winogradskyella sp.]MBT8244129.1 hypothetical protein [Winogradskyella sp.]NNK21721.1 hypothetical protein [Winogradskyella sp.]
MTSSHKIVIINEASLEVLNLKANKLNLDDGASINPDGQYQTKERKQLRLQEGECLNMDGKMFKNTYQHRKMIMKNKMTKKKTMKKKNLQKKSKKMGTK